MGSRLPALCAIRLLAGTLCFAQQPTPANLPRIAQTVDNTVLTTLKGNTLPLATSANDRGPVNTSLAADRMQLVLKRSSTQERALTRFLGALQDNNSPQYGKWLTPEAFGTQYGVSEADIQTISTWLASEGFTVSSVNKARTIIEFSGTVGQLQTAFHTQIHQFVVNGEQHMANVSDPRIPSALAPIVAGISRLNDFFSRPQHTSPMRATYDPGTRRYTPAYTTGNPTSGYSLYVGPGDAATIYDSPSKLNANFKGTTTYDGTGVTVAVVGTSNFLPADVANYQSFFGLPANPPTVIVDGNDPGVVGDPTTEEALLDLEIAGGLAPGAKLLFYVSASTNLTDGVDVAITRALNDNLASILNVSFGRCEQVQGSTENQQIYSNWQQAAAQGISVTVSSGDEGSAECDLSGQVTQASHGLQVSGEASTPYNIAVGGTDYDVLQTDYAKYASTTNGPGQESALGYIPEEPWNNSTTVNGALVDNKVYKDANGNTNVVSAGGGPSSCVNPQVDTNGNVTGCAVIAGGTTPGYPKPSWQVGGSLNIPADGVRDLPDVSLLAANGLYSAQWALCQNSVDANNNPVVDCVPNDQGTVSVSGTGGTSASSPAFAGMLALISQSLGGVRLGQANYVLYNLANQPAIFTTTFHDLTTGNNSVYCLPGSPDCGANSFLTGYDTGPGYDLASGLGSVDLTQLIDNWKSVTFAPSTTTFTINGGTAPVSITHGQPVTFSATVAGAGGTPSGPVAILSDIDETSGTTGQDAITSFPLTGGTTGAQTFNNLPGGSYTVYATYGGDITFAQSQSTPGIPVTVAKEASVLMLKVLDANAKPASGSYPYGSILSVIAAPVGESQANAENQASATGTVTFTDTAGPLPGSTTGSAAGVVQIASNGGAEVPITYWSPAAHSINASYSGDNSLNPSTAGPVTFTVTQAPTATTATSNAATVTGGTFLVTAVITPNPASMAAAPTGTITLTIGGTTIGMGTVSAASTTMAVLGSATITVDASALASGANSITVAYSGDDNYAASSGTVAVTYTPPVFTFTFSPAPTAVTIAAPGASGTSTITVTPGAGYPGTAMVNLSCALSTQPSGANATYYPACALSAASLAISGTTPSTVTATLSTTGSVSGALAYPQMNQKTNRWYIATGGMALACVLFFGIPARRRSWRSMLALLVALVTMAGVGCGGGNNNNNSGISGTTAGMYTFTITGTVAGANPVTATVNVTVN